MLSISNVLSFGFPNDDLGRVLVNDKVIYSSVTDHLHRRLHAWLLRIVCFTFLSKLDE